MRLWATDQRKEKSMAKGDYSGNVIFTIGNGPNNYDKDVYNAAVALGKKTQAYHIDWWSGQQNILSEVRNYRLYLHGHGDFMGCTVGNLKPAAVAEGLVNYFGLTEEAVSLISVTGCNAARGTVCVEAARDANIKMINPSKTHPDLPGLTFKTLTEDSRLVDTTQPAEILCKGSFAQQLQHELCARGVNIPMYARLYVVVIEDDGQKRTMHYHPILSTPSSSFDHYEKKRTKVKITSGADGQRIEYVNYGWPTVQSAGGNFRSTN